MHSRWALALLGASLLVAMAGCGDSGGAHGQGTPGSTPTSSAGALPPTATTGISPSEAAQIVPLAPLRVSVGVVASGIAVSWPGTGQDAGRYQVYRRFASAPEWQPIATVLPTGDDRATYQYVDMNATHMTSYVYGVSALSFTGTQSAITQSATITA